MVPLLTRLVKVVLAVRFQAAVVAVETAVVAAATIACLGDVS